MNSLHRACAVFLFPFSLLAASLPAAAAPSCSRQSPAHTVALLELYTSEGCDDCPPADRFVSNLDRTGLQAQQVVPLSLHVDYWDYIGWKDRFGAHLFTERQRWLTALAHSRTVYTPQFFISGREVRNWASQGIAAAVREVNTRPARADIRLALGRAAQGQAAQPSLPVEVDAKAGPGGKLFLALYENGLSTDVKAGENRGATLRHDYVVRDWIGPLPVAADAANAESRRVPLPRMLAVPEDAVRKNLGVVAFIQNDGGEVLQALSMPLCNPG